MNRKNFDIKEDLRREIAGARPRPLASSKPCAAGVRANCRPRSGSAATAVQPLVGEACPCLDREIVAALVAGALDTGALGVIDAHLARCGTCRELVADAAHGAALTVVGIPAPLPGRLGQPEAFAAFELESSEPPRMPLPRPGDILANKYRIEKLLGRGGMGRVYAAVHIQLGQRVAIKVLHRGEPGAQARLIREARVCARLVTEHVPRVYDLDRLPGGAPYLVMECLVGEDLTKVMARGPVAPADAVGYMLQACAAVAEAHEAGVIHRDLKPANLFLTARSAASPPMLKVLDFGISKALAKGGEADAATLTRAGVLMGSPLYMSPEQFCTDGDVDERSDIWSIGVILYELLAGRPPFRAPTLPALAVAIATQLPLRLSSPCGSLPRGLARVVSRCLEKEPAGRYASVPHLMKALAPFAAATSGPRTERLPLRASR